MMRLMVISDIHGKVSALNQALERYRDEDAEDLLLLGDLMAHGPRNGIPGEYDPPLVAQKLNRLKERITAVRGNCDAEVDQMLLEFPILADYALYHTGRKRLILTHGHLPAMKLPPLSENDLLLSGHTHLYGIEVKPEGIRFNPGSISLPRGGNPPTYGLITDHRLEIKSLDSGEIIQDISY